MTELQEWKDELASCDLIFHRAASNNSRALFGGRRPGLTRGDSRLRNIPFPTKRATYKEVKRVQEVLARVEVLTKEEVEERRSKGSPGKKRIHRLLVIWEFLQFRNAVRNHFWTSSQTLYLGPNRERLK